MPHYLYALLTLVALIVSVQGWTFVRAKAYLSALPKPTNLSWLRIGHHRELFLALSEHGGSQALETTDWLNVEAVPPTFGETRASFKSPLTGAAVADGLLAGLPVAEAIASIDPSVLAAINASTADRLHAFPSIHSYVQDHFFDSPVASADGWFERLTGYVAEQKAAAAFEAAGHHVVFASTANQPVWDLMVDGHPVQIKEGLSGVRAYLAEHHGVAIYTGNEVAASVKDPIVHGISELGSEHVHSLTESSLHGIHDSLSPSFPFPIVTLGFAVWREARLLYAERTTFEKALKNVGVDVAGVGAGLFAGAKTGAFLGAIFGPMGAAIGGLVGGVCGGVSGKLLSTSIRHSAFEHAKQQYKQVFEDAQTCVQEETTRSQEQIRVLSVEYDNRFSKQKQLIEALTRQKLNALMDSYNHEFIAFAERFPLFLNDVLQELRRDEQVVLAGFQRTNWIGWLYPRSDDYRRAAIRLWFLRARLRVRSEQKLFRRIKNRDVKSLGEHIATFVKTYEFESTLFQTELYELARSREQTQLEASGIEDFSRRQLQDLRSSLILEFSKHVDVLHERLVALFEDWNRRIKVVRERMVREAHSVDISI